jgi:hypothetical protein
VVSDVIDEVVATMILWNNVCTASPYLDDVRSGASKGLRRVWFVRFVVVVLLLLQILAFGVLFKWNSWLPFDVAISTSSFGPFYSKVWHLQDSTHCCDDKRL